MRINLLLVLLTLFLVSPAYANGVIQVDQGSVYVNFPGSNQWELWQRDFELPAGARVKSDPDYVGRILFEDGDSIALMPETFYHLRENMGFYQEYSGQWRLVARKENLTSLKQIGERFPNEGKAYAIVLPQTVVRLSRPGQFERKVFREQLSLFPGDVLELPPGGKADMEWWEGSVIHLREGSLIELGSDGFFLKQGAAFAQILSRETGFEVMTSDALISVKGTSFEVIHASQTQINVFEGVVRWNSRNNGRAEFVSAGERVQFLKDRAGARVENFDVQSKPEYAQLLKRDKVEVADRKLGEEERQIERIQRSLMQAKERGQLSLDEEEVLRMNFQQRARALNTNLLEYLSLAAAPGEDTKFRSLTGEKQAVGSALRDEQWRTENREETLNLAEFLRDRQLDLGEESRKKVDLVKQREEDLSQRLRARIQKEEFDRRGNSQRNDSLSSNLQRSQELVTLRNFRNQKQLDLKRLENDSLRLVREKDLVVKKLDTIESSLLKFPDQRERLEASLVALRVQKRTLEERQRLLNERIRVVKEGLSSSQQRINELVSGLRSKDLQANQFQNESRRRLGLR